MAASFQTVKNLVKFRNNVLDEEIEAYNDFMNTIIALFSTVFSGLVFIGTKENLSGNTQIVLYCLTSFTTLLVVLFSLSTKFIKLYIKVKNLEGAGDKLKNFDKVGENDVLVSNPPNIASKIQEYIPWIVYSLMLIDFILIFLFSISLALSSRI